MPPLSPKKSFLQKQIPTILGLLLLVVALGAGIVIFSQGTGVFSPRATPQTTPKNIKVTNINDTSFTVSFVTDEATAGFVKYGTEASSLRLQAGDDRDQLTGSVGSFTTHHITLRGLEANTPYHYVLGTGSQAEFDNNGQAFTVTTAARGGTPAAARTIYGAVVTEAGSPADGTLLYISVDGVSELSTYVRSTGSWAVPLSTARKLDGSGYAVIDDVASITITAQAPTGGAVTQVTTTVAEAQPVPNITLGQGMAAAEEPAELVTLNDEMPIEEVNPVEQPGENVEIASDSAENVETVAIAQADESTVSFEEPAAQAVTTSQPLIVGKAAPNVVVTLQVNSETQINQQVTANSNGTFELDIATLSQNLEPGEHSATYSYVDPVTNRTVTKTVNFTVAANDVAEADDTNTLLAQADTQGPPYGSGNPVPIGGATTSASASPSATPVASSSASRSAQVATTSALPRSGSVGMTQALLFGGFFFIIAGCWSLWVSRQMHEVA
ncbi:MAG: fibronectin type III domain-containing protein [bacterium]|nr:fibronectin type III domain-containing protein [bacterium]